MSQKMVMLQKCIVTKNGIVTIKGIYISRNKLTNNCRINIEYPNNFSTKRKIVNHQGTNKFGSTTYYSTTAYNKYERRKFL